MEFYRQSILNIKLRFTLYISMMMYVTVTYMLFQNIRQGTVTLKVDQYSSQISFNGSLTGKFRKVRYLFAHFVGGLGNQLWIYSSLYGAARKTGRIPFACNICKIGKLFENLSIPIYSVRKCNSLMEVQNKHRLIIKERHFLNYDVNMITRLKESTVPSALIAVYFQNLGYFSEYFSQLNHQYVFRQSLLTFAQTVLHTTLHRRINRKLNNENTGYSKGHIPTFVAVHVRRGNMMKHKHTVVPGRSYFTNAIAYFQKKFSKDVIFIVLTNDIGWSKENIKGDNVYFAADFGTYTAEEDFAIGVACNHTIMSVGTFGWWIGFLAGGEVIYLKDWVKGNAKQWYREWQYFPPKFKPMQ